MGRHTSELNTLPCFETSSTHLSGRAFRSHLETFNCFRLCRLPNSWGSLFSLLLRFTSSCSRFLIFIILYIQKRSKTKVILVPRGFYKVKLLACNPPNFFIIRAGHKFNHLVLCFIIFSQRQLTAFILISTIWLCFGNEVNLYFHQIIMVIHQMSDYWRYPTPPVWPVIPSCNIDWHTLNLN